MLILLVAGGFATGANAQTVTIGSGTGTSNYLPVYYLYDYNYTQTIYTAAQIGQGGLINKIRYIPNSGSLNGCNDWVIYMGNTAKTTFSSISDWVPLASMSQVFSGALPTNPTVGAWMEITLSTPFLYNGTDNLVIAVDENTPGWVSGGLVWRAFTSGTNTGIYKYVDGTNPDPASPPTATSRSGTIPQIQLNLLPPCTGTPVAGTVPSSVPACVGSPVTLTATGGTVADGLTYQWLESPNGNAPWTAVGSGSGATTTSYTTPPFSTTAYYRMAITCTPSGLTDTTNVATVIDGTIPPYAVFDGISLVQDFEAWANGCSTSDKPSPNWNNTPPTGLNSWRRDDQGSSAGWTSSSGIYSPVSSSGTRSARFHSVEAPNSSTGTLDLYVDMTAATGNTKLKFAHINVDGADVLSISVSTNGGSSFTSLGADLAQAASWTEHEYTIASTSATTVIRFRATSDLGSTDIGLDNVRLVTPCSGTPAAATASAVPPTVCAGNSTVISATGISTLAGISLQWEDSPDGITGWAVATGGSGATTASYTTPGLLAPRYYRLKQSCSYSALSSYSNTVAVLMNNATYATYNNVSYTEGFESWLSECSTTDIPSASWRVMPTTGNNSWRRHDQGVTGAGWSNLSGAYSPLFTTGAYSARFHSYNTSLEGSLDLHIDMSAATGPTRLSFDHINTSGTDILGVWVSTDGGQNFNQVGNNLGVSATWTNRTFDFNINSATTVIRLLAKGDNGSTDIGVDNLLLAPSPSCVTPLNLTVGIASPTSVNLSWDASVSNPSNGYVWEVRTAGLPGNPGTADANGSTAAGVVTDLASGLTAGVTYNAYVRSDCGGVDTSAWIGPVTFTAGILQIGSGATTNTNFPISSCSAYNYTQQIYLGTEYASGTYITKLKFKYISSGTTIANWNNWTVYMGNTAKTEFASTTDWVPRAQMSQVFSGTVTPVAGQWMEIALSPGFVWDGSSNIVVAVDENTAGTSCTATWSSFTPTGTNRGMYVRGTTDQDPNSPATGTRNSTLAQIQFEIGTPPSCLPPTQLSANNVTATDADLNWTASTSNPAEGYQWEVRSDGGAGGSGATGRVDNGLTAAGIVTAHTALLAATTPYTFFVRAICSPGDSSVWAGPYAFTTPCATYPAPFTQNFDAALSLPNCWANIGAEQWLFAASGSTSPGYGVSASVDHTTGIGNFAWVDGSGDIGVNSLETPMIDMSALTAPYVSFWMLSNNTDDGAQNQIRLDVWDGAAWVALLTYGGNSASWLEHTATVPGGIPSTTKFRLVALPSTTGTGSQYYNDLLIDDFSVIETPTCLMPTGLTATNLTTTSADLNWTASTSNPANGYQWEVRTSGAGGDGPVGLVDNGNTAAGIVTANTALLAANTTYTLYVRSDCNGTFSLWAGPANFTTPCVVASVPFTEGFESGYSDQAAVDGCWSQESISGSYAWTANSSLSTYNRAARTGSFNAYLHYSDEQWLFHAITLNGGTPYRFSAYARQDGATTTNADLTLAYGTTNTAAGMTNTLVTQGLTNGNYQFVHGDFTPGATGVYYVGIKGYINGTPWYISLDDISVIEVPTCEAPTALAASNLTATSADLSWTASTSLPANGYQWEVRTSGAGGSGATGLTDSGNTAAGVTAASTSALAAQTTYTLYVRSDCNGDFSPWAASSSFTTLCSSATLPWTENFDALTVPNLPTCWTNEVGLWVLANAASDTYTDPRSTPNYLRTRYGADDYIWSPAFDLTATTSYDYAFWYATDGLSGWTTVELYVNTTPSSTGATLLGPALSGPTNTAYQQFQRSFVPSSTDTYYFGIHVVSNFTPWYIAFDDFSMNVSPSCLPPSALTATNILATSADLSWTASTSNPANGYQWEVRTSGAGGSGATGLTDNGTTAAGVTTASTSALAAQTTYTLYVRGDCNGDMSPWAASSSFSTPCNASVAPYTENFDAAIALPNCWANIGTEPWEFQVSGGGGPDYGVAGAADHTSGTGNFAWIDGSGGFVTNSLETPFIDMSALTVPYVTFWMLSNNTNDAAQNQIRLDAWDGAAWVTLLTYGGNSASWLEHNTALPGGIPSTTKFRLVALPSATGNVFYNDLLIDDFSVTEAPACVAPTNLTVPAYTASSADLSWTASVSNPANGYLWEVRTSGAGGSGATGLVDNGGTAAGVTTASSLVLSPNTTYYAYVSADCGATQSGWIGPESFYTGYCIPAPTSVDGTGITNVAFGSLNNPSGAEAGNYGDYTGLTGGDVQQTTTATVSITFSTSIYDYATKIWVDWNNDLDFNDVGEEVYTGTSGTTSPNTLVANFPVGGNALGSYRMRIGGADVGPPTPCYTGTYATFEDYTLNITAPPACPTPTNAAVTGITATSASFSWTDNGSGSYDYEVRTSGAAGSGATGLALSGNVAGSPVALALTSNTAYTAYVRSFCAPDSSAWSIGVNFTTPCVAFTLPFQEGFNSSSTTQACWTVLNVNGDGDAWDMNYATNPQEGDQSAVLYTDFNAGANDDWLISPALTLSGADRLRYWYRVQSSSEPNDFEVLLSTTGNSPGDFTNTLVPFAAYSNTTYQEEVTSLAAYSGTVYIAWHVPSGGLDGWRLYIDNVVVEEIPACQVPTALGTTTVTSTSASFSWTASPSNPANGYQWEVRTSGAGGSGATGLTDSGNTGAGVTTASTGVALVPNTAYQLYVRSDCAGTFSTWAGPLAFYTGYCVTSGSNSGRFVNNFSTTNGYSNITNLGSGYSTNGYGDYTGMAVSDTAGGSVNFTAGFTGGTFAFRIWVDWNNDLDFTDPNEQMFNGPPYSGNFSGAFTVPLGTPLGSYRMRIRNNWSASPTPCDNDALGEAEDYTFNVVLPPSCLQPTALQVSNVTATSADFSWTASTSTPANGYQWEVRTSGAGGSGAAGLSDSGNTAAGITTANSSLLAGSSTYILYVRSDCSNGDFSTWAASSTFNTPCTAVPAPYTQNFDAALSLPNCWANIGTEQWQFQVSGGSGPDYGVTGAVDHTSGTGNFAWVDGSGNIGTDSLETPMVDMSALTVPYVRFWMLSNNTNDGAQNQIRLDAWDGAAWVALLTYGGNSPNWLEHTATLPGGIPTTTRFRLVALPSTTGTGSQFYNDLLIDDFSVVEAPTCLVPTGATATNITTNSADLSWTASVSNPANGYDWEVRTSGAAGSGATGLAASGSTAAGVTTANAGGLSSNTSYSLYVRANCGVGDQSFWTSASTFTTGAACGDDFTDTGGPTAPYGNNENWVKTYCRSTPGDQVRVLFSSFNTEANYDKLFIFNGPNTAAPKFASANGNGFDNTTYGAGGWWGDLTNALPGPFTSSNASGCLTFAFVSDGSGTRAGWTATTTCITPNNTCAAATPVLCGNVYSGVTSSVPNNLPAGACAFNGAPSTGGQNWFLYTGGATNEAVTLSTCGNANFDTRISVFTGPDCNTLSCVSFADDNPGCATGSSEVTFTALASTNYWIAVHGAGAAEGSYNLTISCAAPCAAPANDGCGSAQGLTNTVADGSGTPATYTNICASVDAPTTCSGALPVQGVWFSFNSGAYDHALITLLDNGEDNQYSATTLDYALYTGGCAGLGATGSVACATDAAGTNVVSVTQNTPYLLLVYNTGGSGVAGTFGLMVEHPAHNDAAITAIIDPAPGILCSSVMAPQVTLLNNGDINLTSVQITYGLSGGASHIYNWTGNLAYGASTNITLPTVPAEAGQAQTLTVATSLPNGVADDIPANDSQGVLLDVGGEPVVVKIKTDNDASQLTWVIYDEFFIPVAQGGPYAQANTVISEYHCLSTSSGNCFMFQLTDGFGDGLCCGNGNGYWALRTPEGGVLLRDLFDATVDGNASPTSTPAWSGYPFGHSICLPPGPANIAPTECGIMNNNLLNKVYCNKVTGATKYQFEFSDPDAGYMRRIARNRNYIIFQEMQAVPLTPGVTYFARVRTDRDGPIASAHFGTGCEMGLGVPQVVPCTELIQAPAYGHSCNETRAFNTNNSFIYAQPVVGGTEYQFRLINTQEGYDETFIRNTYILQLKWNNNVAPMLQDGYTYNVQINVKVNGLYSGFCPSSCNITIDNSGNRPEASMTQANFGEATLWPNPVRDGQVNLNIEGIQDADQQITVDIQDIYGKQVFAKEFGNSGERFNTILNLSSDIASGVYMVNITVNGKNTVQRLSIIR
jgi:hypothetical protein